MCSNSCSSVNHSAHEESITNRDSAREADVDSKPVGIGVTVRRIRGLITVVDVKPDYPAATLLKAGQIVLQIDGTGRQSLLGRHVGEFDPPNLF